MRARAAATGSSPPAVVMAWRRWAAASAWRASRGLLTLEAGLLGLEALLGTFGLLGLGTGLADVILGDLVVLHQGISLGQTQAQAPHSIQSKRLSFSALSYSLTRLYQ
jgi:membrane-bound ClpP family serine protease